MNGGEHPFYKIQDKKGLLAVYVYGDFGETLERSGPMADVFPHRFSTKYHDGETGLCYYGYRFYNPALKRWMNRDPIGEEGGVNLYGFCGNNGVNVFDLFGLWALTIISDTTTEDDETMWRLHDKESLIISGVSSVEEMIATMERQVELHGG